jgi:hypothetical protein
MTELQTNIARLKELPQLIRSAMIEANHKAEIESMREALKQMRVEFFAAAAEEVDSTGKKVYSNDKTREARALELQNENKEYSVLEDELSKVEMTAFNAGVELETLKNEFSALKYAVEAQTEELRFKVEEFKASRIAHDAENTVYREAHERLGSIIDTIKKGFDNVR